MINYFVIFLILTSLSTMAFAEPIPEPEPQHSSTAYENCGPGTTLQNGICIVEESQKKTTDSSGKWGTITFPPALQLSEDNHAVPLFDNFFPITQKQVRYDMFYDITNATINDVQLNCDSASFTLYIISNDNGVLQLDVPKGMLDGIFMVLVDGKEWDDVSIDGNVLTVNFTKDTTTIEVLGTYNLSTSIDDGVCDVVHDPPHSYILSPLMQDDAGIPFREIQCKPGLELVGKMPSADPKCVKPESIEKLTIRGWASVDKTLDLVNPTKYIIDKNNISFEILYSVNGATVDSIVHDADVNSIHISFDNSVGGQLIISIPRGLIDAKIGQSKVDDMFFLLIDGEENMYGEITDEAQRTITIWFPRGSQDIEIIGTNWI